MSLAVLPHAPVISSHRNGSWLVFVVRSGKTLVLPTIQCAWCQKHKPTIGHRVTAVHTPHWCTCQQQQQSWPSSKFEAVVADVSHPQWPLPIPGFLVFLHLNVLIFWSTCFSPCRGGYRRAGQPHGQLWGGDNRVLGQGRGNHRGVVEQALPLPLAPSPLHTSPGNCCRCLPADAIASLCGLELFATSSLQGLDADIF